MSEAISINTDQLRAEADKIAETSKGFYQNHREAILFGALVVGCYFIERRMVRKVVQAEIAKVPLFALVTQIPEAAA